MTDRPENTMPAPPPDPRVMSEGELIAEIISLAEHRGRWLMTIELGRSPDLAALLLPKTDAAAAQIHKLSAELLRRLTATERPAADTEHIAKALHDANSFEQWDRLNESVKDDRRVQARAIVDALYLGGLQVAALSAAIDGEPT